jgi:tight adherence protein B
MSAVRILNIIIIVTVFVLVFSVWCFCVFAWLVQYLDRLKKIKKRLGLVAEERDESKILRLWRDAREAEESLRSEPRRTFKDRLERIAYDAGWHTPFQTVVLGVFGAVVLASVLAFAFTGNVFAGLGTAVAIVCIFVSYTGRSIKKRTELFERQLIDALGIAARSLRAGHPLSGSFQLISEEIPAPLGDLFYRICQEQALGLDMRESIRKVASDTSNTELRLFATAVVIQLHSGGNLADLMDSLSAVIRARVRLLRRARVLTAQTNLSAKVLIAIPIVMFILLNITSPDYMEVLYTSNTGQVMLTITIFSVAVGWWVMRRLSVLRF